jgi:2-polyprenyl-3-methyl-5-hydroxy-6-metoxy-1,4-benzoquinol methylase
VTGDASRVNREYYESAAGGRDDYWRFMAAPRARVAMLLALLGEEPARSLVDLGCGGGQLLREIAARNPGVALTGLDLARRQIEENRLREPGVRWDVADLSAPVEDPGLIGRFEVVVASEILEHLDDPRALLENARRLAAPGGRLLLSTQSGPVRETERRVGHRRHFAKEELDVLLRETGWTEVRVWNAGFPFHDLSKWWANRNPDGSVARFGERPYGATERLVCALLRGAFALNSRTRGAQLYAVARRGAGA